MPSLNKSNAKLGAARLLTRSRIEEIVSRLLLLETERFSAALGPPMIAHHGTEFAGIRTDE